MKAKSNFFNFEDIEEHYTLNCMYFERQIHWCTQNHLLTSSSIHQEGSIRNISVSKMIRSNFVNFELQGNVMNQFVYFLHDKSNDVVKITFGHMLLVSRRSFIY